MTAGAPSVRPSRPSDRPFLRDLAGEVFSHLGDYARMIPDWIDGPGASGLIAVEDRRPVGFAITCLAMLPEGGETPIAAKPSMGLDLMALAVVPGRQRRGLGGRLLDEVLAEARRLATTMPLVEVTLTVDADNVAARRLFESRGFRRTDTTGSYPRGQTALNFSLPLNGSPL